MNKHPMPTKQCMILSKDDGIWSAGDFWWTWERAPKSRGSASAALVVHPANAKRLEMSPEAIAAALLRHDE
jgi:hypothetical protein